LRIGVGLWTMQSTAAWPGSFARSYDRFAADAAVVERHGFDSVWCGEHRFWYDGWCPAPLHAQAFAAARTDHVRFGTAMLLLPQHDAHAVARNAITLDRLSGGRLELGLGLGYRDEEFAAVGLRRSDRARLMEEKLEILESAWSGPKWIGGMAPAALERAARRGHSVMLPQTLSARRLRAIAARHREQAPAGSRIGVLRDVHIEPDPARASEFRSRLRAHYREEIVSWWGDEPERQLGYVDAAAAVGGTEAVAETLRALREAGATDLMARLSFDFVEAPVVHDQIARLRDEVLPLLEEA
jgi:alkanesulfonate monooxygenase SsuD/methylene tetrahydromethanopterin reductase-like flavin-dependent oxidoreductase (luciferase family)